MAGLVPAIHALATAQDVDARDKPAHDVDTNERGQPVLVGTARAI